MKTNDYLAIATAAIATAALTVATFGGGSMEAGNDSAAAGTKVAQPKLTINGVDLSLAAADARVFHAGDQPEFELKAVNTTGQPADVKVCVTMTASSLAERMSRIIRAPREVWTTTESLKLNANETKTVSLSALTNLTPNTVFSVWLADPASVALAPTSMPLFSVTLMPTPTAVAQPMFFPRGGIVAMSFSTVTNVIAGLPSNLTVAR